MMNSVSIGRNT